MSTITSPPAPSGTASTSGTTSTSEAATTDGQKRVLQIPPLPGKREKVVQQATTALATAYEAQVKKAEDTIKKYGLTIEVSRLRDRLARSAQTDLQRLLLSTAGVPELLFNEAIAEQLKEEEEEEQAVKDTSVLSIGEKIQLASEALEQSLSAINESTVKFQESTAAIVATLDKVAGAIEELDEDGIGEAPTGPVAKPTGRSRSVGNAAGGAQTSEGESPTQASSTTQQTGKSNS